MPTNASKSGWYSTGGPWGTGLLILSVLFIVMGVSYAARTPASLPDALEALTLPVWLWTGLWILAGCYGIWKALTPPQRPWYVWPFAGLTFLWSAAYAFNWAYIGLADGMWTSEWAGAAVWGAFGGIIVVWGGRLINPPRS